MSADNKLRAESPVPSGRLSPSTSRLRQQDDDGLSKKDKGFRRYAATVKTVLASFDTAIEEWADYISFLGRLQKALAARPSGSTEIAHKALVAKRLSQCLNPGLPAGVHQKSLEVYAYVFETIGKDGLANDLNIYLPGLAPSLSFASLTLKPYILAIFEDFIADLSATALRPALRSLILALLPGLEEENSEEFERCLSLLDRLRQKVGELESAPAALGKEPSDQYFWQCLFLASITSSSRRPGVLAYFVRRLPILGQSTTPGQNEVSTNGEHSELDAEQSGAKEEESSLQKAIASVASPEPGLLIRCFCTGLKDEQTLVQRGFLDLLVAHLPLNSPVLQKKAPVEDLQKLVAAATAVVARRDMSLNRRLWSWFLGPETQAEPSAAAMMSPMSPDYNAGLYTPKNEMNSVQVRYFEELGLAALIGSMNEMIESETLDPVERARPLRICLSLMDKWDIGGLVVPQLFLRALRSAWKYQSSSTTKEAQAEVLRSANMFFDSVESGIIWSELHKLLSQALALPQEDSSDPSEMLEFVLFVLTKFNIREEEMQIVHMPLIGVFTVFRLLEWVRNLGGTETAPSIDVVVLSLRILLKLMELIPPRAVKSDAAAPGTPQEDSGVDQAEVEGLLTNITTFYTQDQGNIEVRQPLREQQVGKYLLCGALRLSSEILQPSSPSSQTVIELTVSFLGQILRKGPQKDASVYQLLQTFQGKSSATLDGATADGAFTYTVAKTAVLEILLGTPQSAGWIPDHLIRRQVCDLTRLLWPSLSPSQLKCNVEAARALWKLHAISPDTQLVESTIVSLMISEDATDSDAITVEDARRFEVLWIHSPVTSVVSDHRRASAPRVKYDPSKAAKGSSKAGSELLMLERPLLMLLDVLEIPRSPLSQFVTNWLQSLGSLLPIVKALCTKIAVVSNQIHGARSRLAELKGVSDESADWGTFLYYLRTTLNLVQSSPEHVWAALNKPNSIKEGEEESQGSYNDFLVQQCLSILTLPAGAVSRAETSAVKLKQCALSLLDQILNGPLAETLREREIETCLLEELKKSVESSEHALQISIMEVAFSALKLCLAGRRFVPGPEEEIEPKPDSPKHPPDLRVATTDLRKNATPQPSPLPSLLLDCLNLGLRSTNTRPVLENWIAFLGHCLPLYQHSIFQVLLPLVSCFTETLETVLNDLKEMFNTSDREETDISEPTVALLLTGLERTLATAHDQLAMDEARATPVKAPEQPTSGFFGGMVSGVFNADAVRGRSSTGNKRLTVLLSFKDAIRMCFKIWSWGDSGKDTSLGDMSAAQSFSYITLRLRNRTRRLFEHLFAVEPLECLETLVESWQAYAKEENTTGTSAVLHLLNALESSRPKNAIPAIFNAIYSRTNPAALDASRKSSLTSDIADTALAAFLVSYAMSLEDDAMDEIWTDCSTFLRDVLANPMPHRQTLGKLLEFTSVLGIKVDNTNFGEQRRMRRELGDLFNRLLTATLTIRPFSSTADEKISAEGATSRASLENRTVLGDESLVSVLAAIAPNLPKVLVESDRLTATTNTISVQVLTPIVRSKTFPENINQRTIDLLRALSVITEASKPFKKDIGEAFNDNSFFATSFELVKEGWLPLLKQWALGDKERMPELISRLPYPSSAGVLGIGASSARVAADRNSQLNLRRIALLILASAKDSFAANVTAMQGKLFDLLTATAASSPSSNTRAEIYMVLRALILRTSPVHMTSLWPAVNSELSDALSSVHPSVTDDALNPISILHACKLLDTLLALGLDDFQLQEWLFISDTTDALYRPPNLSSVALTDNLAETLDAQEGNGFGVGSGGMPLSSETARAPGKRKPLLAAPFTREISPERLVDKVVRPFLRQLSIQAFESTYGMQVIDEEACVDDLLADLFEEGTIV